MRTRLTELLGIEHPVMLAGMGGVSYSELAAAVSDAGGFGCLGASTMGDEKMAAEIAAVRHATDKPFGVDLLTAMPGGMTEQVKMIIEGGASAFVAGLGVPTEVVDLCHSNDVIVVSMCGKVEHALRAVEAGCDLVVAQGTEAGGHTGQIASFPLVPQIVDAVGDRVPVVAAGGIFDGRGLAAALALGADGVWVGTRFIATPEARGRPRLQGQAPRQPRGPDHRQPCLLGQDDARRAQRVHRLLRQPPRRAQEVPRAAGHLLRERRHAPRWRLLQRRRRRRQGVLPGRPGRRGPSPSSSPPASSSVASSPRPSVALDRLVRPALSSRDGTIGRAAARVPGPAMHVSASGTPGR